MSGYYVQSVEGYWQRRRGNLVFVRSYLRRNPERAWDRWS